MAGGGSRPGRGRELGQEVALHKAAIYQGAVRWPFPAQAVLHTTCCSCHVCLCDPGVALGAKHLSSTLNSTAVFL